MQSVKSMCQHVRQYLQLFIRVGLGCLLIWSSLPKVRQPYDFLGSIYEYELVGAKVGMLVAMLLPPLEFVLGVCLLSGLLVGGGLLGCFILMGMYSLAEASVLWRGDVLGHGCISIVGSAPVTYLTVIRAIMLMAAAMLGYVLLLLHELERGRSRMTSN